MNSMKPVWRFVWEHLTLSIYRKECFRSIAIRSVVMAKRKPLNLSYFLLCNEVALLLTVGNIVIHSRHFGNDSYFQWHL